MKRYVLPVALALALVPTLDTCTYAPGRETARKAIEDHIRAVGPDVVPATISFDVNELVRIDKYSWEARFRGGSSTGAMLIRRSSAGWIVTGYVGETTLDFMASVAAEQWLAQSGEVDFSLESSLWPASTARTTGIRNDSWTSTYERVRAQLAIDSVLRP